MATDELLNGHRGDVRPVNVGRILKRPVLNYGFSGSCLMQVSGVPTKGCLMQMRLLVTCRHVKGCLM